MSDSLAAAVAALNDGRLPEVWKEAAYPSSRPLTSWVANLQQRIDVLHSHDREHFLPCCFSISYMFFPQGFLTSVLQAFARSSGWPLETLKLQHAVKSSFSTPAEVEKVPAQGVYVHGIFVEGGRWDVHSQQLEECRPGSLYSPMPVIHFSPIMAEPTSPVSPGAGSSHGQLSMSPSPRRKSAIELNVAEMGLSKSLPAVAAAGVKSQGAPARGMDRMATRSSIGADRRMSGRRQSGRMSTEGFSHRQSLLGLQQKAEDPQEQYECPLYRTSRHQCTLLSSGQSPNHICTIYLPTAAESSRWILAGVSLVCEPDE